MIMSNKKTLICKQNLFGGTDLLLTRYENWLLQNNHVVRTVDVNALHDLYDETWDVVLLPASEMDVLYTLYKNNVKFKSVLVYNLGMGTLRDSYINETRNGFFEKFCGKWISKVSTQFLLYLFEKNSIVFTDSVGLFNNFKGMFTDSILSREDLLIPIGIPLPEVVETHERHTPIHCCWIGRVSKDFKMKAIMDLIEDLTKSNLEGLFTLTIIGDGDGLLEIQEKYKHSQLAIQYIKNIDYKSIDSYFRENVDICIAMGTSALDSAKNAIATIVISPVRMTDNEHANYRWIYDSKGYSLGEYVGDDNLTGQIRESLHSLLIQYQEDKEIGNRCKEYTLAFDEDKTFGKLFNHECMGIDSGIVKHVRRFYYLKHTKNMAKKLIRKVKS